MCTLRDIFTRLSVVKRASKSLVGCDYELCVCVSAHITPPSPSEPLPFLSFGHSPVEVEIAQVFGRFLRSADLLIVEDDPPVEQRDRSVHREPRHNRTAMDLIVFT